MALCHRLFVKNTAERAVHAILKPRDVSALLKQCEAQEVQVEYEAHNCERTRSQETLSFLNRHNFVTPPPRRIALFAFGNELFLAVWIWILRGVDRRCGTKWSRYGWSFLFGTVEGTAPAEVWVNVCVRCGSGHSEAYLRKRASIRKLSYRCPACGGFNLLTREF